MQKRIPFAWDFPVKLISYQNWLLIMRTSTLILFGVLLAVNVLRADPTKAQNASERLVSVEVTNITFTELFQIIEKQSGVMIMYENTKNLLNNKVTVSASNLSIGELLTKVLSGKTLKWISRKDIIRIEEDSENANTGVNLNFTPSLFPLLNTPPITVRGRILNENGEPVIASLTIKGSTRGTTSNVNGEYELNNVDENTILVISSANTETILIKVDRSGILNITVKSSITDLDEIVINKGYYSEKQRLSTGNVAKINAKEIERQPVINPLQTLQGRLPGVVVTPRSGASGSTQTIQIRGQNSLRTDGNYPLYIIDGVPLDSKPIQTLNSQLYNGGLDPLNSINPENIEAIEILKDADATAIYGSRGANGVVLITTKKGKQGKTEFSLQAYSGGGKVNNKMDLMNTEQYLAMRKEAFENDGPAAQADLNNPNFGIFYPDLKIWDSTAYTDWQKKLFGGTATVKNIQGSLSGGNANTTFRVGGGLHNETTVFPGDFGYTKITSHLNISHISTNNKLRFSFTANYGADKNNSYYFNPVYNSIFLSPNAAGYNPDGTLDWRGYTANNPNPFSQLAIEHTGKVNNLFSSSTIAYEIFKGIQLKANMGYSDLNLKEVVNTPSTAMMPQSVVPISSSFGDRSENSWILEQQIFFAKNIHRNPIELLFGGSWQNTNSDYTSIRATGYITDALLGSLNAASQLQKGSEVKSEYRYNAFFGRMAYNIDKKIFLNLTARRDGSSRFGAGKKFASFGAAGAAWIFSDEKWFKNKVSFINFGKLRGSYGTTGNDQIGDYGYISTYSSSSYNYQGNSLLIPQGLANADYAWEINKKLELAIELGLFNDALYISTSWYNNKSSNQLVGYSLPSLTGFTSIQANLDATVRNSGLEFIIQTKNIKKRNFQWTTNANLTIPKNKLLSFPNLKGSSYANTYVIGYPLSISKVFHSTGVNPATGFYTFADVDGNGVLNINDRQTLLDLGRKFYGGVGNQFRAKGFQLDFFIEFVKQNARGYMGTILSPPGARFNQPADLINQYRWQKANDDATLQKFTTNGTSYNNARSSDLNVDDASFIRLKTVSLSYNFLPSLIAKAGLSEISIFVQGQNLVTFTKYKGLDPEIPGNSQLPQLKMITGGIKFKL